MSLFAQKELIMMENIPLEKTFTTAQLQRKTNIYRLMYKLFMPLSQRIKGNKRIAGKEMLISTASGKIRVLSYNMDNPKILPLFVNIHGGGFILGNPEMDDPYMMNIVEKAQVKILSIDYTLSPKGHFPKALNECYDVIKYAKEHALTLKIDPENIAVGGHSAGGNLSAGVCLMDGEKKTLGLKCAILDYPVLDLFTDPYLKPQPKNALPPKMCRLFNASYCSKDNAKNPLVSPIFATDSQLKALPPTLIITASQDSLCEEAENFRNNLQKAGVTVSHKRFDAPHGFTLSHSDIANEGWQMMIDHLKTYLNKN